MSNLQSLLDIPAGVRYSGAVSVVIKRLPGLLALLVALTLGFQPLAFQAPARADSQGERLGQPAGVILRAGERKDGAKARRLAPWEVRQGSAAKASTINVIYPSSCAPYNCKAWPASARAAFEYAKSIWEAQLVSPVPISIVAYWENMGASTGILGGSLAADAWANFTGAQVPNTWFPNALANRMAGADLDPASPDIEVSMNSAFPYWYFGTDGSPGGSAYDFVSVVVHEIGHGLGFLGSMYVGSSYCGAANNGCWGYNNTPLYPFVYDRYTVNGAGQSLIDTSLFPNKSAALGAQLQSGSVYFNGFYANRANGGAWPRLYAPSPWEGGSSYSHLDEYTYQAHNSLMTPMLDWGEVTHEIDPLVQGIFRDLGWTFSSSKPSSYSFHLPLLNKADPSLGPGISGRVTDNGSHAADVEVELLFFNGLAWSSAGKTKTNSRGVYNFSGPASLGAGQKYLVRYRNLNSAPGRLYYWSTRELTAYTAGTSVDMGVFDIADIQLVSPAHGAAVTLPVSFAWTRRPATPTDSYELDIYGSNLGDPYWWTNPSLGYVSGYYLSALPADPVTGVPFRFGYPYSWEVWVYSPDGGYGISLATRTVVFSGAASAVPEETASPLPRSFQATDLQSLYALKQQRLQGWLPAP